MNDARKRRIGITLVSVYTFDFLSIWGRSVIGARVGGDWNNMAKLGAVSMLDLVLELCVSCIYHLIGWLISILYISLKSGDLI